MKQCVILHRSLSGRERDYSLKDGINKSINAFAETHERILADIISIYLDYDDIFELNPHTIISNLFKILTVDDVWKLINSKAYRWKKSWCSLFFSLIPEEHISEVDVESLLTHLNNTPSNELTNLEDFLSKYHLIDKDIFTKVVKILVNKSSEDKNYARPLKHIFSTYSDIFGSWGEVFESDNELIFNAYIAVLNVDRHFDFNGEALDLLTKQNSQFLEKVIDCIYENERNPSSYTTMPELNFLWLRDSFLDDIEWYATYVYSKEKYPYGMSDTILMKLFKKKKGKVEEKEVIQKKEKFIKCTVMKNFDDIRYVRFIFDVTNSMNYDFRRELLNIFIQENTNLEDFKTLEFVLISHSHTWTGSRVPILEKEKNYLNSILGSVASCFFSQKC